MKVLVVTEEKLANSRRMRAVAHVARVSAENEDSHHG